MFSGSTVLSFRRWRNPKDEIEEKIHGYDAEIPMSDLMMCESCGDIYFNLSALKFCIDPTENMKDLLEEYVTDYAPRKKEDREGE